MESQPKQSPEVIDLSAVEYVGKLTEERTGDFDVLAGEIADHLAKNGGIPTKEQEEAADKVASDIAFLGRLEEAALTQESLQRYVDGFRHPFGEPMELGTVIDTMRSNLTDPESPLYTRELDPNAQEVELPDIPGAS